ncbi:hypothetical protein C8F04DRAFT_1113532 [Mycena alexandri]|uniref:Uncharacterized protein n=1 Tax=Mycena alexandri TaxID=1745969 RepID=A0AAD6X0K9_9AGAR|nr:hypothetical protein C8F04DRAFT_1113532 [Mycena alexandri]
MLSLKEFLYGPFAILFSAVVYLFWIRGLISRKRPTFFVFLALLVLFLLITAHWINAIVIIYHAFVQLDHVLAVLFFITLSNPTAIIHFTLVQISATITDSLVIYRLYVVWSHNPHVAIILPIIFLGSQIVTSVLMIHNVWRETVFDFYDVSSTSVNVNFVSSLIINIYSTGMIIFEMGRTSRAIRTITGSRGAGKGLRKVLAIFVESAVLQTTMTISNLIAFHYNPPLSAALTALQPLVFGISICLIHVRVGLGWTTERNQPQGITLNMVEQEAPTPTKEDDLEGGRTH